MTSRWYSEGDQHCMLTASAILQCICIVLVEAFIHNSITTKNILSSQVLITLTPLPHSLLSHSFPCLSRCLTHSTPSLTPCLHSPASRSSYSVILTHPTQSCVSLFILFCHSLPHLPTSLTPFLTHSLAHLPHSLTHSLTPLPESLSVSLILSRSLFCYSLSNSFTLVHHSVSLTQLPHSFSHSFPCLIDFASLTPSLTPLPHSLTWLTHILPVSLPPH